MDSTAIGRFIVACRKEKALTQAQLAEKLGITNRAVSKWETGKCLPDASLMLELCAILGITVNELLSGERIPEETYRERAERNLVDLQTLRAKAQKDLCTTELIWVAAALLLLPVHLAVNFYYPENTGTGVGLLVFLIGLALFTAYFCRHYEVRLK